MKNTIISDVALFFLGVIAFHPEGNDNTFIHPSKTTSFSSLKLFFISSAHCK